MTWSQSTWVKLVLAATLVLAAFFVAPTVDAATCAPEPPAAHASLDHDPAKGDHNGKGAEHGLCAHGHCHQTSTARNDATEPLSPMNHALVRRIGLRDDAMPSISPDGLKRPPRA